MTSRWKGEREECASWVPDTGSNMSRRNVCVQGRMNYGSAYVTAVECFSQDSESHVGGYVALD